MHIIPSWHNDAEPQPTAGYNNIFRIGPVPRESISIRVATAGQPILSDVFNRFTPTVYGFDYANDYTSPPGAVTANNLRSNHLEGVNTTFLDGHSTWINGSNLTKYVQISASSLQNRIWW